MSSGHSHSPLPHVSEAEVDAVLANPEISARLAQQPQLNYAYDVPYLAGYSQDGRTVYIDRHLPARAFPAPGGRKVNILPFLIRHETVEKAIIDILHRHYDYSHAVASLAEDRVVRAAGFLPNGYNDWLKPYIKADEHEKLVKVPPDLDLTPYIDSHDYALLHHLRSKMAQENASNQAH